MVQPERLLMINGKMQTPKEMNYWLERLAVFKDKPEVEAEGSGLGVTKELREEFLARKRNEYFDEVTK